MGLDITAYRTKPHPGTEPTGDPIEASRWKNLHFDKDGSSYCGRRTYPSEAEAREFAIKRIAKTVKPDGSCLWIAEDGKEVRGYYSHNIQIPWSKP